MFDSIATPLKRFLLRHHIRVSRAGARPGLQDLLDSLRPVKTDHSLIRVGGDGDGGYLVPDDLEGVAGCFSPGVSTVADFEFDLAERGIPCFMVDYSVDGPPLPHSLFDFEKKFLGSVDDPVFTTLESWLERKCNSTNDLILQMDIEGAEYEVLLGANSDLLRKFRILVIEFHRLDALFDPAGFESIRSTFARILREFEVVHIHPNNCSPVAICDGFEVPPVMEFTFLRKDRIGQRSAATRFPHELDRKCVRNLPDIPLPRGWY